MASDQISKSVPSVIIIRQAKLQKAFTCVLPTFKRIYNGLDSRCKSNPTPYYRVADTEDAREDVKSILQQITIRILARLTHNGVHVSRRKRKKTDGDGRTKYQDCTHDL